MALRLAELLIDRTAAEAAQLLIEYDPDPPFDSGSLPKSNAAVIARARTHARASAPVTPSPFPNHNKESR